MHQGISWELFVPLFCGLLFFGFYLLCYFSKKFDHRTVIFIHLQSCCYYFFTLLKVFHTRVNQWFLTGSDNKSLQISRILLSILAVLNIAVVWMVSTRPLISMPSSTSTKRLLIVLGEALTIGITVICIFRNIFQFSSKVLVLLFFFVFFLFYSVLGRDSRSHNSATLFFFFFCFWFFLLFLG